MAIQDIRESWGIHDSTTPPEVYTAKFNFVSGSPGYVGDLFVLQGSHLTGDARFV